MTTLANSQYGAVPLYVASDDGAGNLIPVGSYVNGGTPTETAVSVLVTNTAVLGANPARKYLKLDNDSANIIYVSFVGNAAANTGTRLNANGGSIVFTGSYIPTGAVKAIALSGTSGLLVTEG